MGKFYQIILVCLIAIIFCSCKKNDPVNARTTNTSLINGKWLVSEQTIKVLDLNSGMILKDTTLFFSGSTAGNAWYEIYNTDKSAFITSIPYKKAGSTKLSVDTTSYLHYRILGNTMMLTSICGGSETDPIIQLSPTDMILERKYNGMPNPRWGLDINATYTFIADTYYNKK